MGAQYRGDAVISYGALRSASEVFRRDARLPAVMSLFSLLEAAVLYERLWYMPLGDSGATQAAKFDVWGALQAANLISVVPDSLWSEDSRIRKAAEKDWEDKISTFSRVPTYGHISRQELLGNTFGHALKAVAWAYAEARPADEEDFLTAEGITKWTRHVTGVDFDQAAEDANDGDDDGRYMNWEQTAVCMARTAVVRLLGADYVGDAIEHPIIFLSDAMVQRNLSARLYAKLSQDFRAKVEGLMDDGFSTAMPIPPIVAIILDRSDGTLQSLAREMTSLREEFAAFRTYYRAYMDVLENPAGMTLAELLKAKREVLDEVAGALTKVSNQRTDSRLLSEIVGAKVQPSSGTAETTLEIDPSLSLNALLKLGVERFTLSQIKGRARILFDVYTKAMNIKNYHSLIGRRFSTAITSEEMNGYKRYASAVEGLAKVERA